MKSYISLFLTSFITSILVTPIVRHKAIEWGAIAIPDENRHIHDHPTPRLGGGAIFIAFIITLSIVPFLGNFVSYTFNSELSGIFALLAPATLILLLGIYDDFYGAGAPLKIVVQATAGIMIYAFGYRIDTLSLPFGGSWELPLYIGFPLTVLWIIGITNAFNLIDGMDGLAAGASLFALLSILLFSIAQGTPEISILSVGLIGAVTGFLLYNFNPATIFLGDSGSLFLGFMAAVLSLAGSQKGSTIVAISIPLITFGLPVTEVGLSIARRFISGRPITEGDSEHIHHRLLQIGFSQRQAVIVLYAVCGLFSLFGLMLHNPARETAALIYFVLGVLIVFGVQRLGYPELDVRAKITGLYYLEDRSHWQLKNLSRRIWILIRSHPACASFLKAWEKIYRAPGS